MSDTVYGICENKCLKPVISRDGDLAVIEGTLEGTGTSSLTDTIAFPKGFTKDNCVLIGFEMKAASAVNWMSGSLFNSGNSFGSLPFRVIMKEAEIQIEAKNIVINNETNPTHVNVSNNVDYKMVLLKVN